MRKRTIIVSVIVFCLVSAIAAYMIVQSRPAAVKDPVATKKPIDKGEPVDATSGATRQYKKLESIETCKALGWWADLNGNVVRYDNGILRGGDIMTPKAAQYLKESGITKVFSVTPNPTIRKLCREYKLELHEIPYPKDKGPTPEILSDWLAITTKNPSQCYVHCIGGADRGGTLVAYYRREVEGWTYKDALHEFKAMGGHPDKYPAIVAPWKDEEEGDARPGIQDTGYRTQDVGGE